MPDPSGLFAPGSVHIPAVDVTGATENMQIPWATQCPVKNYEHYGSLVGIDGVEPPTHDL